MKVIIGMVVFFIAITIAGSLPPDLRLYAHATIMIVLAVLVLALNARVEALEKEVAGLNLQLKFEREEAKKPMEFRL